MKLTTNYNLKKPEGSDTVNIEDFNYNSDIIDNEFNTINTKLDEALQLGVNAKDNVVQAINSKKTVPKVTNDNNWESLAQSIRNIKEGSGNAVASDVLAGKTFTNNDGVEYTGTMVNRGGATTVTPTTSNQIKSAGYYSGAITIKGDSKLVASNIKSGVSIFGVAGTLNTSPRKATGTINTPSNSSTFTHTVTGLTFKPRVITVTCSKYRGYMIKVNDFKYTISWTHREGNETIISSSEISNYLTINSNGFSFNSFYLFETYAVNTLDWVAYE